jgi:hypothetical protein
MGHPAHPRRECRGPGADDQRDRQEEAKAEDEGKCDEIGAQISGEPSIRGLLDVAARVHGIVELHDGSQEHYNRRTATSRTVHLVCELFRSRVLTCSLLRSSCRYAGAITPVAHGWATRYLRAVADRLWLGPESRLRWRIDRAARDKPFESTLAIERRPGATGAISSGVSRR